jgi:hypothetical protein
MGNVVSRWASYDNKIKECLTANESLTDIEAARFIIGNDKDDINRLRTYIRRHKNRILDKHEGLYNASNSVDVSNSSVKHLWLKTKEASLFIKNPNFVSPEELDIIDFRTEIIKDIQEYVPNFPKLERIQNKESYLLVLDPADIHIGKLCNAFESGESYDNQIAVKRVMEGVKGILNKVSSFRIDKILFIGGNDILHIDNPSRTTTSGTPQDTDGMWYSNFMIAKKLYIEVLELLIGIADVYFTFNPSNHDYTNGFFLAQVIETYFKNCENITFDCSIAHRKGFQYYDNLIGTTHGDGAKQQDLPLLMAVEFSKEWASTKHRYIYTHHVHHKTSKDYAGITIESLRSPSGTDSWHHRNGYQHAPKAVEGFLHCKKNGQIARITHIFSILFFNLIMFF